MMKEVSVEDTVRKNNIGVNMTLKQKVLCLPFFLIVVDVALMNPFMFFNMPPFVMISGLVDCGAGYLQLVDI